MQEEENEPYMQEALVVSEGIKIPSTPTSQVESQRQSFSIDC